MDAVLLTALGFFAGAGMSWWITRHHYELADRNRPLWANRLKQDFLDDVRREWPEKDPGDLVAIFNQALDQGIEQPGGDAANYQAEVMASAKADGVL